MSNLKCYLGFSCYHRSKQNAFISLAIIHLSLTTTEVLTLYFKYEINIEIWKHKTFFSYEKTIFLYIKWLFPDEEVSTRTDKRSIKSYFINLIKKCQNLFFQSKSPLN